MKIAFTTKGINCDSMMEARFGRTEFLLVFDENRLFKFNLEIR